MMKRTKILATVGPASENPKTLEDLIRAGADAFRLNFSFGTHEQHKARIDMIRNASKRAGKAISLLQDLQGPKIRVGKLKDDVIVKRGDIVTLTGKTTHDSEFVLPTTYTQIASDTKVGKTILLADGTINLSVVEVNPKERSVRCKVVVGGVIKTGKGINLPYTKVSLPALTPKDARDAVFGAKNGVDYVALSFVRTASDVAMLRTLFKKEKVSTPIIAKIEKPEALDNLEEILDAADGLMVARGDLAVEISYARVPVEQKKMIALANKKGKIVITATQMLESMVENPVPTRAEASDVANAILDGTGAIMLSAESATGKYPVKAVETMTKIALEVEASDLYRDRSKAIHAVDSECSIRAAITSSAAYVSRGINAKGIAVFSRTGVTVRKLSKYRPDVPIFAVSNNEQMYNQFALVNNTVPILSKNGNAMSDDEMVKFLKKELLAKKFVKSGDSLILITGSRDQKEWTANTLKVVTI